MVVNKVTLYTNLENWVTFANKLNLLGTQLTADKKTTLIRLDQKGLLK